MFAFAVIKRCRISTRSGNLSQAWEQYYSTGELLAEVVIHAKTIEALVGRVLDGRRNEATLISKYGALELLDDDNGDL